MSTMTTSSSTERVYVLLREAAELLYSRSNLDPVLGFFVTSVGLQALTYVEHHTDKGDGDYPDSVEECIRQAAAETLNWDLHELPENAAQFIIDLSDLQRELASRV